MSLFEGVPESLHTAILKYWSVVDNDFATGTNPKKYPWMTANCTHHKDKERVKLNLAEDMIERYASFARMAQDNAIYSEEEKCSFGIPIADNSTMTVQPNWFMVVDAFTNDAIKVGCTVEANPGSYHGVNVTITTGYETPFSAHLKNCNSRFQIPFKLLIPKFKDDKRCEYRTLTDMIDRIERYNKKKICIKFGTDSRNRVDMEEALKSRPNLSLALTQFKEEIKGTYVINVKVNKFGYVKVTVSK
jgi:hypothetical protein